MNDVVANMRLGLQAEPGESWMCGDIQRTMFFISFNVVLIPKNDSHLVPGVCHCLKNWPRIEWGAAVAGSVSPTISSRNLRTQPSHPKNGFQKGIVYRETEKTEKSMKNTWIKFQGLPDFFHESLELCQCSWNQQIELTDNPGQSQCSPSL